MGTISYNGTNISNAYNVFTDESMTFVVPEKDYEYVSIPNRDGSLLLYNYRMKNVTLPINCFIRNDFKTNFRNLMQFMMGIDFVDYGYKRLELSIDPDHYRTALFTGATKAKTGSFNKSGTFELTFECTPQRWRTDGETSVSFSADGSIENPTRFFSKPLIRLQTSGSKTVIIGGYSISLLSSPYEYIDIDCENMTCSYGNVNASQYVQMNSLAYPKLSPGSNVIRYASGGTFPITITPRWFDI